MITNSNFAFLIAFLLCMNFHVSLEYEFDGPNRSTIDVHGKAQSSDLISQDQNDQQDHDLVKSIVEKNESTNWHNETEKKHDAIIHVAAFRYDYVHKPLLIAAFLMIVCVLKIIFEHCHRLKEMIPESCMLMIIGVIIGLIFLLEEAQSELAFLRFSSQTFFMYLLPPIVLDAAYSLKDRAFFANIGTVMLYAILGTILNVFLVGPILYGFYLAGFTGDTYTFTFLECILFSTIIAAVDPVAVLAIFQNMGVNKMLYFLVFGESLFNDGVTVVLYHTVLDFMKIDSVGPKELALGIAAFICVCLGAAAVGTVGGFATAFITKFTSDVHALEPLAMFGFAYLSYLLAEMFDFSGIISLICCGLIQAHYAMENISSKSYVSVLHFSKVASGVTESLIFIILTVMAVNVQSWPDFNLGFTLIALITCILARFAVTFGLAFCVNRLLRGFRRIEKRDQFIMAYGGLRGAITFSLAFSLDPDILNEREKTQHVLLTSAYVIIFFTTFLQGITMKPLVRLVQVRLHHQDPSLFEEINLAVVQNTCAAMEQITGSRGGHHWSAMSKSLSRRFLRPVVNKNPQRKYTSVVKAYQKSAMRLNEEEPPSNLVTMPNIARWSFSNLDHWDNRNLPNIVSAAILDHRDSYQERFQDIQDTNARIIRPDYEARSSNRADRMSIASAPVESEIQVAPSSRRNSSKSMIHELHDCLAQGFDNNAYDMNDSDLMLAYPQVRRVLNANDAESRHCCCGIKTATFAVGVWELIGCLCCLISSIAYTNAADSPSYAFGNLAVNVASVLLWTIAIGLMFKGLTTGNQLFLIMHIIMQVLSYATCVVIGIVFIVSEIGAIGEAEAGVIIGLSIAWFLMLALEAYFLWVIIRCYRYLKSKMHARQIAPVPAIMGCNDAADLPPPYDHVVNAWI